MSTRNLSFLGTLGLVSFAQFAPAQAISLTLGGRLVPGQGQFSNIPGVTTINFEAGVPKSGGAVYSAPGIGPTVVVGNLPLAYASPVLDASRYLTVAPFGNSRGTNPVHIQFANSVDYFGLYWGSADPYNAISFYQRGRLLRSFTGATISAVNASLYANFFASPGEVFDAVVLSSAGAAFESDNHAYRFASPPTPVPTPTPLPTPTPIPVATPTPIITPTPAPTTVPEPNTVLGMAIAGLSFVLSCQRRR